MPGEILRGRLVRWMLAAALGAVAASAALAQDGAAPAAIPVGTVTVENRPVTGALSVVGRVMAIDRVEVRARVDGFLQKVAFTEGQTVKEGQLLFQIEPDQFQADVRAAEGALAQRQAEKELADVQLARAQELLNKNTGTVVDRDKAKAEADRSAGAVTTAQSQLATAQINLGYTEIRAPIAGRIGRSALTKGAVVGPSSGSLATIVSQNPIYVLFSVSAREFLRRDAGGNPVEPSSIRVRLRLGDGSYYKEEGRIDFVDVTVDQATDTVTGRTTVANPDGVLIDGQLVTVILERGQPIEKPVVPQQALIADQGGLYVFVVEDGKAVVRRVKPGIAVGPDVAIDDGLKPGDQVIIEGIERIRPGAAVLAMPVAALKAN